ncbi:MAG: M42 family metallopeptidase [Firmicutes bacterium]|nr:M42 family metallopeptidase [Bacillota bacterium]
MKEILTKLTRLYGPSGHEEFVRDAIKEMVEPHCDEVIVDPLGNLIAHKKGSGPKLMLAAHMDEIGVMVTDIDKEGFLRFTKVGGVSPHQLLGQRVVFKNGTFGVFGHEKLDDIKDLKFEKMFIDIGATSREEAEEKVSLGDVAVFDRDLVEAGDRWIAKGLDDRAGCAVLIKVLQELSSSPNDIYAVFTVQEEVGTRGAKTSAYSIEPDLGLAVDVTLVGDTPKAPTNAVALGKGPTIKVKDALVLAHPQVKESLVEVAKSHGIPYQFEILDNGGTDAGPIHLTKSGVKSGGVSIPCRYVHSPTEMVSKTDMDNAVKLLKAYLTSVQV